MGNSFAVIMILTWPLVAALLFSRLPPLNAIIWTLLGGYLVLPPVVAIDLPLIMLNKESITSLSALVGAVLTAPRGGGGSRKADGPRFELWVKLLILVMVVAPLPTALQNPEPLIEGMSLRPGLTFYDGISSSVEMMLTLIPFYIGHRFVSSPEALVQILRALLLAGLAYSLPMLLEIRLSPQLNVWIYGFFAHDFSQMIRYGGFRPMVFLAHGLWLALFASTSVMAAAVWLRLRRGTPGGGMRLAALLWLGMVLVLCKSVAALIYAVIFVPVLLLMQPRRQMILAGLIALAAFAYPIARWTGSFPADALADFAVGLDAERGQSLEFRFDNEQILLERATLKPLTGWGGWGRNQIVDPETGRYASVTDGQWIIQLSVFGIIGYLGMFGLLCGAAIRSGLYAWRGGAARLQGSTGIAVAALSVIHAVGMADLIPNATLTTLTWLCAGALLGHVAHVWQPAGAAPVAPGLSPKLRTVL